MPTTTATSNAQGSAKTDERAPSSSAWAGDYAPRGRSGLPGRHRRPDAATEPCRNPSASASWASFIAVDPQSNSTSNKAVDMKVSLAVATSEPQYPLQSPELRREVAEYVEYDTGQPPR
ncbi:MAG: hypothetical protein ACLTQI_08900 [Slackia sp.]